MSEDRKPVKDGKIDWPALIDLMAEKMEEHQNDDGYWANTGPGDHIEDDLKEMPQWEDLTPEEQEKIISSVAASLTFFGIFTCLFCLLVTSGYVGAGLVCIKDFR